MVASRSGRGKTGSPRKRRKGVKRAKTAQQLLTEETRRLARKRRSLTPKITAREQALFEQGFRAGLQDRATLAVDQDGIDASYARGRADGLMQAQAIHMEDGERVIVARSVVRVLMSLLSPPPPSPIAAQPNTDSHLFTDQRSAAKRNSGFGETIDEIGGFTGRTRMVKA